LGGCQVAFTILLFAFFYALKKLEQFFVDFSFTIINMLIGIALSHKKHEIIRGGNIEKSVNEISRRSVLWQNMKI
jgi:hypothetical protein